MLTTDSPIPDSIRIPPSPYKVPQIWIVSVYGRIENTLIGMQMKYRVSQNLENKKITLNISKYIYFNNILVKIPKLKSVYVLLCVFTKDILFGVLDSV